LGSPVYLLIFSGNWLAVLGEQLERHVEDGPKRERLPVVFFFRASSWLKI